MCVRVRLIRKKDLYTFIGKCERRGKGERGRERERERGRERGWGRRWGKGREVNSERE